MSDDPAEEPAMSKVIADITMSLDGYVTGPSGDVDELHAWVTDQDPVDIEILERGDGGDRCGGDGSAAVRYRRRAPMAGPRT